MSPEMGQMSDKNKNTMIIKTLEYKLTESGSFSPIPIRQYSGTFNEPSVDTDAGKLYSPEITAYIPHITEANEAIVKLLNDRPAIYRVTDTKGVVQVIGNDNEKLRFASNKKIGPTPGIAHGWDIKITGSVVEGSVVTYPEPSESGGGEITPGGEQGEDDTDPVA